MNNAGIGPRGTSWEGLENWHKVFDVNVFGYAQYVYMLDLRPSHACSS